MLPKRWYPLSFMIVSFGHRAHTYSSPSHTCVVSIMRVQEAILTCLNKVYLVKGNERAKKADESNPNSISNKVFGCPVVEIVQCGTSVAVPRRQISSARSQALSRLLHGTGKCKKEIKPQGSDSFIYYTYVTEVRSVLDPTTGLHLVMRRLIGRILSGTSPT